MGKVQTQKPILTISLLSSNRRDTIRKCLDSLKTLRERVPSELIIVDTSQNEEMKKILEEYTDKIIPFTWCKDFSKARNAGLDAAKEDYRLLVLPDHPTPICVRTHTSDDVPYLLYDSTKPVENHCLYNEAEAATTGKRVAKGHEMIHKLFADEE